MKEYEDFARTDPRHYAHEYALCVRQDHDGWAGSGFNTKITELEFRMFNGSLQVEISIEQYKGENDRRFVTCGGLTLTPELVAELVKQIQSGKTFTAGAK